MDLHMAQVQGKAEIWGGSDRNRAFLGSQSNPCIVCKSFDAA